MEGTLDSRPGSAADNISSMTNALRMRLDQMTAAQEELRALR
jgi:hypothetical protein